MEEKIVGSLKDDKVQEISSINMSKAVRLAMELSNEKIRLKQELQELRAEYEEVKPTNTNRD